jgi:hypothetical protein
MSLAAKAAWDICLKYPGTIETYPARDEIPSLNSV